MHVEIEDVGYAVSILASLIIAIAVLIGGQAVPAWVAAAMLVVIAASDARRWRARRR